jgi:hypothetical protein
MDWLCGLFWSTCPLGKPIAFAASAEAWTIFCRQLKRRYALAFFQKLPSSANERANMPQAKDRPLTLFSASFPPAPGMAGSGIVYQSTTGAFAQSIATQRSCWQRGLRFFLAAATLMRSPSRRSSRRD